MEWIWNQYSVSARLYPNNLTYSGCPLRHPPPLFHTDQWSTTFHLILIIVCKAAAVFELLLKYLWDPLVRVCQVFYVYPRTGIILAGMIMMMRMRMMRMRMRMEMGALKIGDCRKSSQASQFYFSDGANCFLPVPQLAPKWLKPEKSNLETVQRQNSPF